ncbi:MAG: hypothetical protein WBD17_01650 [Candidatus Omnitrophota bacterium]
MKINLKIFPLGIKIIGIALLLYGILAVLGIGYKINTLRFIISGLISGQIHMMGIRSFIELFVHNILQPINYILTIIANFGFFRLRNWARVSVCYILVIKVVGLAGLLYSKGFVYIEHIVPFVVIFLIPSILVIFYLTRARIKELYS